MMQGQVDQAVDRSGDTARVIALLGGKGGIGKSNIAANMGVALAQRGRRVIILDGSVQFPHVEMMLGADQPGFSRPQESVGDVILSGSDGLRVAYRPPRAPAARAPCDAVSWSDVLSRLRAMCEVVVIDCGSGISEDVIDLALLSDCIVITTTPDPIALTNAYASAKVLTRRGYRGSAGLIVNMVRSRPEGPRVARRFARASARFLGLEVDYLGSIPFDRHVVAAGLSRRPVLISFPRCAASACINRITGRLAQTRSARRADGNVWVRVASLFL